ncbi:GNAT family N-acetyltransferase [Marilutibacter chinensis]|uniref:GNAT family N-acetyltransferase n=1 Tax=Marilutibacter chinensis TaxID=2912247 RepID=A0ABS9HVF4_9GAMM|nr:GNAT family N-acetyltransferase [Lysobacter chinensis]MCF7222184.1 GNAT family N-acetyltransferase [Lysobacter chinensis]
MSAVPVEVRVRPASASDADALALVGAASFLETFAGVLDGADILAHCRRQHAVQVYVDWLERADAALWLAETALGAAPVGYAVLTPAALPLPDPQDDDLELKRIYLLHRFHGGGLGARLLQAAVEEARRRGSRRLALGVYAGNVRAQAFYRRAGFAVVGERRFQIGERQYDDAVMARDL